jgi:hypothetical protein
MIWEGVLQWGDLSFPCAGRPAGFAGSRDGLFGGAAVVVDYFMARPAWPGGQAEGGGDEHDVLGDAAGVELVAAGFLDEREDQRGCLYRPGVVAAGGELVALCGVGDGRPALPVALPSTPPHQPGIVSGPWPRRMGGGVSGQQWSPSARSRARPSAGPASTVPRRQRPRAQGSDSEAGSGGARKAFTRSFPGCRTADRCGSPTDPVSLATATQQRPICGRLPEIGYRRVSPLQAATATRPRCSPKASRSWTLLT